MKLNQISLALAFLALNTFVSLAPSAAYAGVGGPNVSVSTDAKISDPYADNQSGSPWTQSMEQVTTFGGKVVRGDSTLLDGKNFQGFDSYAPYFPDKTTTIKGYASGKLSVGCDGVNLGSVVEGQLSQYSQMVEQFIQQAPALAVMFLAYSQPTVKSVIDEMNGVSQFGLDLTNLSCSGVRAIADKAAEEKAQAMAEARCTAEAGFKDPECMSDDGLANSTIKVMKDVKKTATDRAGQYLGKVSSATGGLVSFTGGSGGSAIGGLGGTGVSGAKNNGVRSVSCSKIDSDGLRVMLLASSGIPCGDIEYYAPLLPDYKISDGGQSGVVPRTMTLRKLASDLVVKYEGWVNSVLGMKEVDFINSDAFKAIYNRTGVSITVQQHRKLNQLMTTNPAQGLAMIRNMAQLIALKDLTSTVNNIEVAVLTGIQNQSDDQALPELRRTQYVHAIEGLKAELSSLTEEVNMDLKRNEILKSS
ncbi:hypothetical protein [Pseudomonas syringae]|uniref:hypothetical protein n=1 Tax=Pseudomonas syringae TaxID=317 RepID=UPI001F48BDB2|nr:hypothetical protein [Pseudomonas syringae]MCF5374172.1 hypothetical protein [Pseudomonas syringae]